MRQPRRRLAAQRKAAGFTQEGLAEAVGVDRSTVGRWEAGATEPQPWQRRRLAETLGLSAAALDELIADGDGANVAAVQSVDITVHGTAAGGGRLSTAAYLADSEACRQELHDELVSQHVSPASADDWEQLALRYGTSSKDRPAVLFLADVVADFTELRQAMQRCHSATVLRRLTRVAAQLSGLTCLTLIKLDERQAFRRWARTARIAAQEADDPATSAWVLAQEAYGHFYSDDLSMAVAVAQQAQTVGTTSTQDGSNLGGTLAAALEARAQAGRGQAMETRRALDTAERLLSTLDADATGVSAFGYNEAQLRFHESNALTHLGHVEPARTAQEQALALVAPDDFMDRSLTQLDQAMCFVHEHDAASAVDFASRILHGLSGDQRQGIITGRTRQLLAALPDAERTLPPVRELNDLLMLPEVRG